MTKDYTWRKPKPGIKKACNCAGRGVVRVTVSTAPIIDTRVVAINVIKDHGVNRGRYVRCPCGKLPDSWGAAKLAEQAALDARLEEIKKGQW
jgi:hypothetical protein